MVPRLFALFLLLAPVALAVDLTVAGDAEVGQKLSLNWNGISPWRLDILTAGAGDDDFTLYRTYNPITVVNGVWLVDVPAGTFVEFQVTDGTGSIATQIIQISPGAAVSSASVATLSSISVQSTQSVVSAYSVTSVLAALTSTRSSLSSISTALTTPLTISATSTHSLKPPISTSRAVSSPPASNTKSVQSPLHTNAPPNITSSGSDPANTGVILPAESSTSSSSKAGAIAGGVIGGILAFLLVAVILRACWRRRQSRLRRSRTFEEGGNDNDKYPFAVSNVSNNPSHRRTLSRPRDLPDTVNWNPEEPHLTPNLGPSKKVDLLGPSARKVPRRSSAFGRIGEFLAERWSPKRETNALSADLTPAPQPSMTTVPDRPSVLDIARSAPRSDIPLYNPTSTQQPGFGTNWESGNSSDRHSNDADESEGDSPFADKFSVQGKYEPDLQHPSVSASYSSATGISAPALTPAPRPSRPPRPQGLGLDTQGATSPTREPPAVVIARQRHSVSNPGPMPTVGHKRKISGPIPIVLPNTSPDGSSANTLNSLSSIPSWALARDDSRYPMITIQSPTTASTINSMVNLHAGPSGMAGVGAGGFTVNPGRPIYPAAMGPVPTRTPQTRTSVQSPVILRSPPQKVPLGPRPKPTNPPAVDAFPLTPPRRITAEPDVPVTPTTPNLSSFPTPPRGLTTTGSLSSLASGVQPPFTVPGSSFESLETKTSTPLTSNVGSFPEVGQGQSTLSPPAVNRGLQPPPISTSIPYPKAALSPVAGSPNSTVATQVIPTPLASSTIASPVNANRFGASSTTDGLPVTSLARDNSSSARSNFTTTSSAAAAIRQEMMEGIEYTSPISLNSPSTPIPWPEPSNFRPPVLALPHDYQSSPASFNFVFPGKATTALSSPMSVPRPAVDSWGMAPSSVYQQYDGSTSALGRHISLAATNKHSSATSARRLSDVTNGDAEWKELERQL
ncbi:hypothetical protein FRB99_008863, partial [Tulasnella sp. 403]